MTEFIMIGFPKVRRADARDRIMIVLFWGATQFAVRRQPLNSHISRLSTS